MCIGNAQWTVITGNAQVRYVKGKKQECRGSRHTPACGGLDPRSSPPLRASTGSYRISVCGSASTEGGPLVRRDGFTNTPWPGGQRKYARPWTVPLCFPAEESIKVTGQGDRHLLFIIVKKKEKEKVDFYSKGFTNL